MDELRIAEAYLLLVVDQVTNSVPVFVKFAGHQNRFHEHQESLRVRFSCPADGYNLDDLDAFRVVIDHARRKILEQQPTTPQNILPTPDDTAAFTEQQTRLAVPS